MADICPVCKEKIGLFSVNWIKIEGSTIHYDCRKAFFETNKNLKRANEKHEQLKQQEEEKEKQEEEKALYKSVYIKGGIDVKGFSMPFGEMVEFMVKWAIASIPAFFILFIIFGIFFAIFGALFF